MGVQSKSNPLLLTNHCPFPREDSLVFFGRYEPTFHNISGEKVSETLTPHLLVSCPVEAPTNDLNLRLTEGSLGSILPTMVHLILTPLPFYKPTYYHNLPQLPPLSLVPHLKHPSTNFAPHSGTAILSNKAQLTFGAYARKVLV